MSYNLNLNDNINNINNLNNINDNILFDVDNEVNDLFDGISPEQVKDISTLLNNIKDLLQSNTYRQQEPLETIFEEQHNDVHSQTILGNNLNNSSSNNSTNYFENDQNRISDLTNSLIGSSKNNIINNSNVDLKNNSIDDVKETVK